jgi:succinate-semialdehyde dehydrogenase / glutarate-semialdehyde dehydrogenase
MFLRSINPATGQLVNEYNEFSIDKVNRIIQESYKTFLFWKQVSFVERAQLMKKAALLLRVGKKSLAYLMAVEMGKPIKQGIAEAEKCAWVCDYYAENAASFLKEEEIKTDASKSFVALLPLGPVLAVMPWNFPLWQVFRFAAPALMAGNTGLLKHSSNVQGCALAIEKIFAKAGFPENVFRTLVVESRRVGPIIENPFVKAVTLTGSTPAGRSVAAKAGERLKKTVLELGGSDPYIIFKDANIEKAAKSCATSRLINSGQSCIAAKRFIVVEKVLDGFTESLLSNIKSAKMGDPLQEDTNVGPLARYDLREELHQQVLQSLKLGAKCLTGGDMPPGPGAFYSPTVLTNVKKGMPAYEEELFGPVAAILPVKDEQEAIAVANDSVFGLGAAIFSENIKRAEEIATNEIEAGCCFVNEVVRSDPRLPFGGIKESGYGRELSSYGIKEFVNIKTVYIK